MPSLRAFGDAAIGVIMMLRFGAITALASGTQQASYVTANAMTLPGEKRRLAIGNSSRVVRWSDSSLR